MSPATLYREGTDLDALLAELDGQYPDRVRVVEITHPREGGVMGFFAKQRIGVHYRLLGHGEPVPAGYDDGPFPHGLDPELVESSGGYDAPAATDAAGPAPASDASVPTPANDTSVPTPANDSNTQFAQILAELAVRKAATDGGIPRTPVTLGPSVAALESARTATAQVATDERPTKPQVATDERPTKPRAVARFQPTPPVIPPMAHEQGEAPQLTSTSPNAPSCSDGGKSVAPAFSTLPHVASDGTPVATPAVTRLTARFNVPAAPPTPSVTAATDDDTAHRDAAAAESGNSVSTRALDWPLATEGRLIPRQRSHGTLADPVRNPDVECPSPRADLPPSTPAPDRSQAGASRGASSFALRRQLVELGVSVDRVPNDAVHAYAAVEKLVAALDPAPAPPTGAGQILVIAGPASHATAAAETLAADANCPFEEIWSYGCPGGIRQGHVSSVDRALPSVAHAGKIATELRETAEAAALVVIATDGPTWTHRPTELIQAIGPDGLWAVVDATWKPGDARRAMRSLGSVDAVIVANAERSGSPATVWDMGAPIAMVDGRPSTPSAWAIMLLGKLAELERECSDDPS